MIDSFSIKNFRSFNDIEVKDLRLVNIIVGDNGSGKTALLEALFLAGGVSPEVALRTRTWRGYDGGQMSGSNEDLHEALWGDLFHKFQSNRAAVVSLKGQHQQHRSVTVRLTRRGQTRAVAPGREIPGAPVRVVPSPPIEFKWQIRGANDVTVIPTFADGRVLYPPVPDTHISASFFAANRTSSAVEIANHFSSLSKSFHEIEFVDRFRTLYPNINTLSVEVSAGAPMLFAAVDGLPQKLPITLASGGMNKLAAMLLAMPIQSGGLILVDEIENGFYYERLPIVWDALLNFARQYDCQIFASTHSAECLNAAARLAENNTAEFCMLRTVLERDGTKIRHFDGQRFVNAVLGNIEVR